MQRYDTNTFRATKTDEGFIMDAPIIGRAGLLRYLNADGSERWEYRPPEEAFNADSLASIRGKPITLGHHGLVRAANAKDKSVIGMVLSEGRQDGDAIKADVSLFSLPTEARELSCGYTLELEEKAGTTADGRHYDAIQRHIRYNHLAVVPRGRAGIARLNMDGEQEVEEMDMVKVKTSNGIEYDAAPEVGIYVKSLEEAAAKSKKEMDTLQAKYDAALADIEKAKKERADAEEAAKTNFKAAVKARCDLLDVAKAHKVEVKDDMDDKAVKVAIIHAVRGNSIKLDGKSDDYIEAIFDICKAEKQDVALSKQLKTVSVAQSKKQDAGDDVAAAYAALLAAERDAYTKEVK